MKSTLLLLSAGAVPLALLIIANTPHTPLRINAALQMALWIGWTALALAALGRQITRRMDYPPLWRTPATEAAYRQWEAQRGVRQPSPRAPYRFAMLLDVARRIPRAPLFYVLLLALTLRVWALDRTIPFLVDEAHFMQSIVAFRREPDGGVLLPINGLSPFTRIYTYGQTITSDLFGSSWFGFRVFSAVIGTATVAALYALAKALFPTSPIPLLSALLLAALPPHLHFSRLALIQIADGLAGTLALAGAAWALRQSARGQMHAARWWWVLSGAALGMTQYFYEGGRLFFPVLWLAYVGGALIWREFQKRSSDDLTGFMRAVIVALLVAAPALYGLTMTRANQPTRLSVSGLSRDYWIPLLLSTADSGWLADYGQHAAQAFTLYIFTPEQARYYGRITPLLLPYVAPFFLLGMIVSVRQRQALPLAWVLLTSLGSSLLTEPAVASRFLSVLPALALLSAGGVTGAAEMVLALKRYVTQEATSPPNPLSIHGAANVSDTAILASAPIERGSSQTPFLASPDEKASNLKNKPVFSALQGAFKIRQVLERLPMLRERAMSHPYGVTPNSKRQTPNVIAFGITILLMLGQVYYYFVIHLPLFVQQSYAALTAPSLEDAALRAAALPAGTPVYLIAVDQPETGDDDVDLDYPRTMATYFTRGAVAMRERIAADVTDAWLAALPPDAVVFIDPADTATETMLTQRFDPAPPTGSPQTELPADKAYQLYVLNGGAR